MRRAVLAIALAITSIAGHARDDSPARAAVVQPPAWVERAGTMRALAAGAPLFPGDRFQTGTGGRLHLALADGSTVKLGSEAGFELPALRSDDDGVLRGALKVVKGAFRFTTSALGKLRKRELDVYIGPTITAGIRGTDIWGKSDPARELLCLIEGKVEVTSPGAPIQVMDQPESFYVVPRGEKPLPIEPTPPGQIAQWAVQTEMRDDAPALRGDGAFSVALGSFPADAAALAEAERLSTEGYAVDVVAAQVKGKAWHRLVVKGFATRDDAARFAADAKKLGFRTPWVL